MVKKRDNRRSEIESVGSAIDQLLNTYNLKGRFDENRLIGSWGELMGPAIAKKTGKIFIKKSVMFIEIDSAPLKHELNMQKSKVLDIISKEIGQGIIDEIIFL